MKYNKLVRDKIPEIIAASGKKATFRILTQPEYMEYLEKKLDEEVAEFHESKDVEELADIIDVIHAIAKVKDGDLSILHEKQTIKLMKNGSFSNKILLIDMED